MAQNPYLMNQIAQGFNFNPGGAFMQGQQDRMAMIAAQYQQQLAQMQMAQAQAAQARQQAVDAANQKAATAFGLDPSMAHLGIGGMAAFKDAVVPKAPAVYEQRIDPPGFPKGTIVQVAPDGKMDILREPPAGPDPKDVRAAENELRDEYNSLTDDYRKQFDAYGRIVASAADPSAAGDLALIFNYMKLLDPGSTVREGEFANAQNSGGIPARVQSMYNNVLRGERLSESIRADFLNRSGRMFEDAQRRATNIANVYTRRAERNNVNPANVVTDFSAGLEVMPSTQSYLDAAAGDNRNGTIDRSRRPNP